uniref:Ig-like domain-containing protein n=1 Tax=Petromyzon marinus TaxID=7757 RepID=S4RBA9_PETMA
MTEKAPSFIKPLQSVVALEGSAATFEAEISGLPVPEVSWFRDGQAISSAPGVEISFSSGRATLTISAVSAAQSGKYSLRATNGSGQATSTAELLVTAQTAPPNFTQRLQSISVSQGKEVRLDVRVTGIPAATVKFFREGAEIHSSQDFRLVQDGDLYSLIIAEAYPQDSGTYSVTASNNVGRATSSAQLLVTGEEAGEVIPAKKTKTIVSIGGETTISQTRQTRVEKRVETRFEAHASGHMDIVTEGKTVTRELHHKTPPRIIPKPPSPTPQMQAVRQLSPSPVRSVRAPSPSPVRSLSPAGRGSSASPIRSVRSPVMMRKTTMQATATGEARPPWKQERQMQQQQVLQMQQQTIQIQQQTIQTQQQQTIRGYGAATVVKEGLKDTTVVEGESVRMECQVAGFPTPAIMWFREEYRIERSADFQIAFQAGVASLTIREAFAEDSGRFTCTATNEAGTVSTSSYLLVQGEESIFLEDSEASGTDTGGDGIAPYFVQKPQPQHLVEGGSVVFHCQIKGSPKPHVYWKKSGIPLTTGYRRRYKVHYNKETGECSLEISMTFSDDAGEYTCVVRNKQGDAAASARLMEDAEYEAYLQQQSTVTKDITYTTQIVRGPKEGDFAPEVTATEYEKEHAIIRKRMGPAIAEDQVKFKKRTEYHISSFEERIIREIEYRIINLTLEELLKEDGEEMAVDVPDEDAVQPAFETKIKSYRVFEGMTVTYHCKVSGSPLPKITWYKNGQRVRASERNHIESSGEGLHSLRIPLVQAEHEGVYTVLASNARGNAICSAKLFVEPAAAREAYTGIGMPPQVAKRFRKTSTKMRARIACPRDSSMSPRSPSHSPVRRLDETDESVIERLYKPVFVQKPNSVQVPEGQTARFDLKVVGRPMPDTVWFHNGHQVVNDYTHKIVIKEDGTQSLIIIPAMPADTGEWTVIAENRAGKTSITVQLIVDAKEHLSRPHFVEKLRNVSVKEGAPVQLSVKAAGNPIPDIVWLKNSEIISSQKFPNMRIEGATGESALSIDTTTQHDSAWYTSTAINKAGRDTTRCKVNVEAEAFEPEPERKMVISKGIYKLKEVTAPELEPLHLRYGQEQWEEGDLYDKEKEQKPLFKKKLTSVRLKQFGPVHFECRLTPIGDPTMVVEWLHDSKPLDAANRFRMVNEFGYCSLDYEVAYPRDSGIITCRATNKYGADQTSATLIVKDEKSLVEESQLPEGRRGIQRIQEMERQALEGGIVSVSTEGTLEKVKPEIVLFPEPARVLEGETARYRCRVTGYPQPRVSWYLNGQLIHKSKRYRLRYDGIYYLDIVDCKSYDSGEVKLLAENPEGKAEHTVKIEVQLREDFRTLLRKAPEPKPEGLAEPGKPFFEVVKVKGEQAEAAGQPVEVVKLKRTERNIHEKQTEETDELRSKFKRRTEEGYYEAITAVELKSRKKDEDYQEMLRKRREELLHWSKELPEEEVKEPLPEGKITIPTIKPEKLQFTPSMEAPKILERIQSQTVPQFGEAHFRVRVVGKPDPECQWFKNGIKLEKSERIYWYWPEDNVCELVIRDVIAEDSASVMVKAINVVGETSSHAFLLVQAKQVITFTQPLADVPAKEKDTMATFECELSEPFVKVKWFKGDQEIFSGDKYRMHSDRKVHMLSVLTIEVYDDADFTCALIEEPETKSTARLIVETAPLEFTKELEDIEVPESLGGELECVVTREDSDGKWYHKGKEIEAGAKYQFSSRRGRHTLLIRDVAKEDQGEYTFEVEGKTTVGRLKMKPRAVTLMQGLGDLSLCEGDIAQFEVRFSHPGVEGQWLKGTEEVQPSERVHIVIDKQAQQLLIEDLNKEDGGKYSFIAFEQDIKSTGKLDVKSVELLQPLKDVSVVEGTKGSMECKVSQAEVPGAKWYHNGELLKASDRVQFITKGTKQRLVLTTAFASDEGQYKIVIGRAESTCKLTVEEVKIIRGLEDKSCMETENLTFEVELSHSGVDTVWLFKDQEVKSDDKCKIEVKGKVHRLTVSNVMKDNEGEYIFSMGEKKTSGVLSVSGGAISKPLQDISVSESQVAVFECEVVNPDVLGHWLRDGKELTLTNRVHCEDDGRVRRLIVDSTTLADQAEYSYQVATSKTAAKLKVEAVKIKKTLKNQTVIETQTATFTLELSQADVKGGAWIKNGVELASGDKYEVSMDGTVHTLRVHNCNPSDESVYNFKLGKLNANARLHVEVHGYHKRCYVSRMSVVTLHCGFYLKDVSHFCNTLPPLFRKMSRDLEPGTPGAYEVENYCKTFLIFSVDSPLTGVFSIIFILQLFSQRSKVGMVSILKYIRKYVLLYIHIQLIFLMKMCCFMVTCGLLNSRVHILHHSFFSLQASASLHDIKVIITMRVREGVRSAVCKSNDPDSVTLIVTSLTFIRTNMLKFALQFFSPEFRHHFSFFFFTEWGFIDGSEHSNPGRGFKARRGIGRMQPYMDEDLHHEVLSAHTTTTSSNRPWAENMAPTFTQSLKFVSVKEGQPAVFHCRIIANPTPSITWYLNNRPLQKNSRYKVTIKSQMHDNVSSLEIEAVRQQDSGSYKVFAINSEGSAESIASLIIAMHDQHNAVPGAEDYTHVTVAEKTKAFQVRMEKILGLHTDEVQIKPLEEKEPMVIHSFERIKTLRGRYRLSFQEGTKQKPMVTMFGEMHEAPQIIKATEDMFCIEGDDAMFECLVFGDPEPSVTWAKEMGRSTMFMKAGVDISWLSTLSRASDAGDYSCVAKNVVGEVECCSALFVEMPAESSVDNKVSETPPAFLKPLTGKKVYENGTLIFVCEVVGKPPPEVLWMKDRRLIQPLSNVVMEQEGCHYILQIKDVKPTDAGVYVCEATNFIGEAKSFANVEVLPVFDRNIATSPVTQHHFIEFDVDQDDLSRSPSPQEILLEGVQNVDLANREIEQVNIDVGPSETPPRFEGRIADVAVPIGAKAVFASRILAAPAANVAWYKDDVKISSMDGHYLIANKSGYVSLEIKHVSLLDRGMYLCKAVNGAGESSCRAALNISQRFADSGDRGESALEFLITEAPPKFTQPLGTKRCAPGCDVSFECQVIGEPAPDIAWFRNDVELRGGQFDVRSMGKKQILTVKNVSKCDEGSYKCTASNSSGTAQTEATLSVGFQNKYIIYSCDIAVAKYSSHRSNIIMKSTSVFLLFDVVEPFSARVLKFGNSVTGLVKTRDTRIHASALTSTDTVQHITVQAIANTTRVRSTRASHRTGKHSVSSEKVKIKEKPPVQAKKTTPKRAKKQEGETIAFVQTVEGKQTVHSEQAETMPEVSTSTAKVRGKDVVHSVVAEERLMISSDESRELGKVEAQSVVPQPHPKSAVHSHLVESVETLPKEVSFVAEFPEMHTGHVGVEGVREVHSLVMEERQPMGADVAKPFDVLDSAVELQSHKEVAKPLAIAVVQDQASLQKEMVVQTEQAKPEKAQLVKETVLKSLLITEERKGIKGESTEEIVGVESAVNISPKKESKQDLHTMVVKGQDTLPKELGFAFEIPVEEKAESSKDLTVRQSTTGKDQWTIYHEMIGHIDKTDQAVIIQSEKQARTTLHSHVVSGEAVLPKEDLIAMVKPDSHTASSKVEKSYNQAVVSQDRQEIPADHITVLDSGYKSAQPNVLNERQSPLSLTAVSKPMQLQKEGTCSLKPDEFQAVGRKQPLYTILLSSETTEVKSLQESHTDSLAEVEAMTADFTTEPKPPVTSIRVEKTELTLESTKSLGATEVEFASGIQEGQRVGLPLFVEERQVTDEEHANEFSVKTEETLLIEKQPQSVLHLHSSKETTLLIKEDQLKDEEPKVYTLDIRTQVQDILTSIIVQKQVVMSHESVEILGGITVSEVDYKKESRFSLYTYQVTNLTATPFEFTLTLEGYEPQRAVITKEVQAALHATLQSLFPSLTAEHSDQITAPPLAERARITEEEGMSRPDDISVTTLAMNQRIDREKEAVILESPKVIVPQETPTEIPESVEKREVVAEKPTDTVPVFITQLQDATVPEGDKATFTASITHAAQVNWYHSGRPVVASAEVKCLREGDHNSLTITKASKEEHEGEYACEAINFAGKIQSTAQLNITKEEPIDPPSIIKRLEPQRVREGDPALFECQIEEVPLVNFQWFRGEVIIKTSNKYKISTENFISKLEIVDTQTAEAGEYTCKATNPAGFVSCTADLKVIEMRPPSFVKKLEPIKSFSGKAVQLIAEVSGTHPIAIVWSKDGDDISDGDSYAIRSEHNQCILAIGNVAVAHQGTYACKATNEFGSDTCSAQLSVTDKPSFSKALQPVKAAVGTPLRLECEVDDDKGVTVAWTKSGKEIRPSRKLSFTFKNKLAVLEILKSELADTGDYVCTASSEAGSESTASSVEVKADPAGLRALQPEVKEAKGLVHLDCSLKGSPVIKVTWFKNDNEVKADGRVQLSFVNNVAVLEIRDSETEDSADYTCEAQNEVGTVSCTCAVSVKEIPSFKKPLESMEVRGNSDVTLEVELDGSPPFDVKWVKNARELPKIDKYRAKLENTTATLRIGNFSAADVGQYSCKVKNNVGKDESHANIKLKEPPKFTKKFINSEVSEGSSATLNATLIGSQPMTIAWSKDKLKIAEDENHSISYKDNHAILTIVKAEKSHAGEYTCDAKNEAGAQSCSAVLSVKEPATFVDKMESVNVTVGEVAFFECRVAGSVPITVRWRKDHELLKSSKKFKMTFTNNVASLKLMSTDKFDTGEYYCEVQNDGGSSICNATLTILDRIVPPTFVRKLKNGDCVLHAKAVLECKLAGSSPLTVSWFKGVEEISDSDKFKISFEDNTAKVEILNASQVDEGTYTCKADNAAGTDSCWAKVKVMEPPSFKEVIKPQEALPGAVVSFTSVVSGTDPLSVKWFKDGTELLPSRNSRISFKNLSAVIELDKVDSTAAGEYSCQVSNAVGTETCSATLFVKEPAKFETKLQSTNVNLGDTASFNCTFTGTPEITVRWFRKDEELQDSDKFKIVTTATSSSLEVLNITSDDVKPYSCRISNEAGEDSCINSLSVQADAGEYVCTAANEAGTSSCNANLIVKERKVAPTFDQKLQPVEVTAGDPSEFECHVTGSLPIKITWSKNNKEIRSGGNYRITFLDNTPRLIVMKTDRSEGGVYTCKATNETGSDHCSTQLEVKERTIPPDFDEKLESLEVTAGLSADFECHVTGSAPFRVTWTKDNRDIRSGGNYKFTFLDNTAHLTILKADKGDIGTYTCKAANAAGSAACTADLSVKDRPVAPSFVRKLKTTDAALSSTAHLECKLSGSVPISVVWFKGSEEIAQGERYKMTFVENVATLEIQKVVASDAFSYTCKATNVSGSEASTADLKVIEPPSFTKTVESQHVVPGASVEFKSSVSGTEPLTVKWFRDDNELMSGRRCKITFLNGVATLKLDDVDAASAGVYSCQVSNAAASETCSANLTVKAERANFRRRVKDSQVSNGETAVFSTSFSGTPEIVVFWYKQNNLIEESDKYRVAISEGESTLEVLNVDKSDEGIYTCKIQNEAGEDSCLATLATLEPPNFIKGLEPTEIVVGSTVHLECQVAGTPQIRVSWYKGSQKLKSGDKCKMAFKNNLATLELRSLTKADTGDYSCKAENDFGSATSLASLSVSERKNPPYFTRKLKDWQAVEGTAATFDCRVTGTPPFSFIWYKHGVELSSGEDYVISAEENVATLDIHNVKLTHAGEYTCRVFNDVDSASCSAKLEAKDKKVPPSFEKKPDPVEVTAGESFELECLIAGSRPIRISWLKNNREIRSVGNYKLFFYDNAARLTVLKAGKEDSGTYVCKAVNEVGSDTCSAQVTVKDHAVPPTFVRQLKETDGILNAPVSLECKISGTMPISVSWYKDQEELFDSQKYKLTTSDHTVNLEILELGIADGGNYTCKVNNVAGKDSCSAILRVTIAEPPGFSKTLEYQEVLLGEYVRFQSIVTGTEPLSVKWFADSKELKPTDNCSISFRGNRALLELSQVDSASAGEFTCQVANAAGIETCSAKLFVKVSEPGSVRLECEVAGTPVIKTSWFKDDVLITSGLNRKPVQKLNLAILELRNVQYSESGEYVCKAENDIGSATSVAMLTVTERKNPPVFTRKLKDVQGVEGGAAMFDCRATGTPPFAVAWFKHGKEITPGEKYRMSFEENVVFLEILNLATNDEEEYSCTVSNDVGKISCAASLEVKERKNPPSFDQQLAPASVTAGEPADLGCHVTGSPPFKISWLKDNKEIRPGTNYKFSFVDNTPLLTILKTDKRDSGVYVCRAANEAGYDTSCAPVTIKERRVAPTFDQKLESLNVTTGERAELECHVTGSVPIKVTWAKDNREIRAAGNYRMIFMENIARLTILKVGKLDSGIYTCAASNDVGSDVTSTEITVKDQAVPPSFVRKLKKTDAILHSTAQMDCRVAGTVPILVAWSKNGVEIVDGDKYRCLFEENTASLEILKVDKSDDGSYTCTATNVAGRDSCSTTLSIIEPPSFLMKMEPQEVLSGSRATFQCAVSGTEPLLVKWYKGNQELRTDISHSISFRDSVALLIVEKVKLAFAGEYSCQVSNSAGKTSCSASLFVKEPAKFFSKPSDLDVKAGDSASFICSFVGTPKIAVNWYKEDNQIVAGHKFQVTTVEGQSTLDILATEISDSGNYTCKIQNDSGQDNCTALLKVLDPPYFVKSLEPMEGTFGTSVYFECQVAGAPEIRVTWYKGSQKLSGAKYKTMFQHNTAVLEVKNFEKADVGTYSCEAENSLGSAKTSASLAGKERKHPPSFSRMLKNMQQVIGDCAKFDARVTGTPPFHVSWFLGDSELSYSDKHVISFEDNVASLSIFSLKVSDAGEYTCKVSNEDGSISCSAKLDVTERKTKPTFDQKLEPVEAVVGDPAELECHLTGSLPIKIFWMKDKKDIRPGPNCKMTFFDNTPHLTIYKLDKSDSGEYTCKAVNDIGSDNSCTCETAIAERKVAPMFTKKPLEILDEEEGKGVKLDSRVSGSQPIAITWTKDDKDLHAHPGRELSFKNNIALMSLKSTKVSDSGLYVCKAENEAGTATFKVTLNIKERKHAPNFDKKVQSLTVVEGDTLSASCRVSGSEPLQIMWLKDRKEVQPFGKVSIAYSEGDCTLEISQVTKADAGEYTCKAVNEAGSDISKVKVTTKAPEAGKPARKTAAPVAAPTAAPAPVVVDGKIFFVEEPKNAKVEEKGTVKFTAKVGGEPIPTVKWIKGKWRQLNHGGRLTVQQKGADALLEIREATKTDAGPYRCVANNRHGEIESGISLDVEEKKAPAVEEEGFRAKLKKAPTKEKEKEEEVDILELLKNVDPKEYEKYARLYGITDYRGLLQALELLKAAKELEEGAEPTAEEKEYEEMMQLIQARLAHVEPITLVKSVEDRQVLVGNDVSFEVEVKINYPEIKLSWYRGTQKLESSDKYKIFQEGDLHHLVVTNCTLQDRGNYRVVCGPHISSAKLEVYELRLDQSLEDKQTTEGETVELTCTFSVPNLTVQWYRNSKLIQPSQKYTLEVSEKQHRLVIHNTNLEDAGQYTCRYEDIEAPAELTVEAKPLEFTKVIQTEEVRENETHTLECEVTFEDADVSWYKNDEELQEGPKYSLSSDGCAHYLTIKDVTPEDEGSYAVIARKEDRGEVKSFADLFLTPE